jgi:hypothetical protein
MNTLAKNSAMENRVYTENEINALDLLVREGGSVLETSIPDRNEVDHVFKTVTPGHTVYRKLERLGLVFYSEEDPLDLPGDPLDGFTFTREIYITDSGHSVLSAK